MAFTKAERSTATRRRLIATARALFAKRGFAAVGTEEIVRRARVTRIVTQPALRLIFALLTSSRWPKRAGAAVKPWCELQPQSR
jgi:hypothetical protein